MQMLKPMVLGALAMCAGCATKEMKSTPFYTGNQVTYTGRVENRVNLWPAAYYREPVGSVAWPLLSFSNDHFALRPIYSQYKQDGMSGKYDEFNVLWPIAQFDTKHDDYRIFPFCWGSDYFVIFPEFWWNRNTVALLPFMAEHDLSFWTLFPLAWYDKDNYFVLFPEFWWTKEQVALLPFWARRDGTSATFFPFYWWRDEEKMKINSLLPLWWYSDEVAHRKDGKDRHHRTFSSLAGLTGVRYRDDEYQDSWFFPLYYHGRDELVTPLYGKAHDTEWLLPFYIRDQHSFASLFYTEERGENGKTTWCVPPLLSGGSYSEDVAKTKVFLGLGGYERTKDGSSKSWTFPLFYKDDNLFLTALFGTTKTADWVVPLYYRDRDTFLTMLFGKTATADWLLPLYYRNEDVFVTTLFGKTKNADWLIPFYYHDQDGFVTPLGGGTKDSHWILPLYAKKGGDFISLPYGHTGWGTAQTNTWWCTPLVGTRSGQKEGGWLFPLFDRSAIRSEFGDYSDFVKLAKRDTLPAEIVFKPETIKRRELKKFPNGRGGTTNAWVEVEKKVLSSPDRYADDDTSLLVLSRHHRNGSARMSWDHRQYNVRAERESGNALFFKYSRHTSASFDPQTRKRVSSGTHRNWGLLLKLLARGESATNTNDGSRRWELGLLTVLFNGRNQSYKDGKSKGMANVLGLLYHSEWDKDGSEESSVLWRVWHREKQHGHVSVDMFPGFTYDSKSDGYHKTSFLWRLFRYENEPGKGKSFDLFFLPLMRP